MARFESCPDIIAILTLNYSLLLLSQEFARRALTKINELSQLEAMSSHKESKDVEEIFRYATVKVGTADVTISPASTGQPSYCPMLFTSDGSHGLQASRVREAEGAQRNSAAENTNELEGCCRGEWGDVWR